MNMRFSLPKAAGCWEESKSLVINDSPDILHSFFDQLQAPPDAALEPGFYLRVRSRMAHSESASMWVPFVDPFTHKLLAASLFFLLLAALGYQVVAENNLPESNSTKSESSIPVLIPADPGEQRDAVLTEIVTYPSRQFTNAAHPAHSLPAAYSQ